MSWGEFRGLHTGNRPPAQPRIGFHFPLCRAGRNAQPPQVSDPRDDFSEAILTPFPDPSEERLHAQRWLEEALQGTDDQTLAQPLKRLRQFPAKSPFGWATVVLLVISLITVAMLLRPLWKADQLVRLHDAGLESSAFLGNTKLTPEQRLLLGDPRKSPLERKEELWRSDPDDPAYYSEYVLAYGEKHHALPPSYWDTVRRIDPSNAWFDYLAAEVIGTKAVQRNDRGKKLPPEWEIVREKDYREALTLMANGRDKPRLRSYSLEMARRRIALLPQGTHRERLGSMIYLLGEPTSNVEAWRICGDLLATEVYKAGKAHDAVRLRAALGSAETHLSHMLEYDSPPLMELLGIRSAINQVARQAETAAAECGEPDVAKRFTAFRAASTDRKNRLDSSRSSDKLIHAGQAESMILSPVVSAVENPPP